MGESAERKATQQSQPVDRAGIFANLLSAWYPKDYVVGVIDDLATAQRAAEALRDAGFPADAVRLFPSDEVVAAVQAIERHRNVFQRIGAALQREVSEEGLANKEYDEETAAGHHLLTVLAVTRDEIERAREILVAHGARRVMHYERATITDLR